MSTRQGIRLQVRSSSSGAGTVSIVKARLAHNSTLSHQQRSNTSQNQTNHDSSLSLNPIFFIFFFTVTTHASPSRIALAEQNRAEPIRPSRVTPPPPLLDPHHRKRTTHPILTRIPPPRHRNNILKAQPRQQPPRSLRLRPHRAKPPLEHHPPLRPPPPATRLFRSRSRSSSASRGWTTAAVAVAVASPGFCRHLIGSKGRPALVLVLVLVLLLGPAPLGCWGSWGGGSEAPPRRWERFLPVGRASHPGWSGLCV